MLQIFVVRTVFDDSTTRVALRAVCVEVLGWTLSWLTRRSWLRWRLLYRRRKRERSHRLLPTRLLTSSSQRGAVRLRLWAHRRLW